MRPFGKRTDHDVIQAKQYLDKKMGIDNDDKPSKNKKDIIEINTISPLILSIILAIISRPP
jgi:1,4-dihydroxy-2-naphthoate octaprenyltransferase